MKNERETERWMARERERERERGKVYFLSSPSVLLCIKECAGVAITRPRAHGCVDVGARGEWGLTTQAALIFHRGGRKIHGQLPLATQVT
jgi:hypothetical protein